MKELKGTGSYLSKRADVINIVDKIYCGTKIFLEMKLQSNLLALWCFT